jgi:hypothetical protein
MLRKKIHFLCGGGIGLLFVAAVIIFNHYQNSQPKEPVKIYKGTVPSQQVPETVKQTTLPDVATQPETVDIEEAWDAEVEESAEVSEEFASESGESAEPAEPLLATTAESLQEYPKVVLLKEVFPEFDRLLSETQELVEDMQGGVTPENYAALETRGRALEAELNDYCLRIAEEFPGSVTFIPFQGEEWVYDVDFQMLKDSFKDPIPSELEPYFRYTSMRDMFGLPEIPPEQLQQMQLQPIRR